MVSLFTQVCDKTEWKSSVILVPTHASNEFNWPHKKIKSQNRQWDDYIAISLFVRNLPNVVAYINVHFRFCWSCCQHL